MSGDRSSTLLPDGAEKRAELEEEQLPDRDDFGGGDFLEDLGGLGGLEGLGDVPSVGDITLEEALREDEGTSKCLTSSEDTSLIMALNYLVVPL